MVSWFSVPLGVWIDKVNSLFKWQLISIRLTNGSALTHINFEISTPRHRRGWWLSMCRDNFAQPGEGVFVGQWMEEVGSWCVTIVVSFTDIFLDDCDQVWLKQIFPKSFSQYITLYLKVFNCAFVCFQLNAFSGLIIASKLVKDKFQ